MSLFSLHVHTHTHIHAHTQASRRQLSEADGRSLAYLLSGLADQEAVLDGAFAAAFWEVARERAEGSDRDLDLLIVRMLVEAAGQLGMRPDRDLMQVGPWRGRLSQLGSCGIWEER